ncbi:SDR family oxidoreductase [Gilvimarinus sp. DA14]|uniref:SDR family oxidoreductase n=1 Tax=Gilvimarinus sp. DA14 TaxID=2956798 RepID=UPI0020B83631|nr:SDR family oxidoreductase [Gilvimarinus sp. DA14]UTF61609.1 SDR family oxidoreductase [Gilvimarinus sp. DA14]
MTTLVIGAGGQIGRMIVRKLHESGKPVIAMLRKPDAELESLGIDIRFADLEEDFSHALTGCDQVIFTAGSGAKTGADKTILVDMWGAIKAIDAANKAGIKHFVMVSSRGAEDPDNGPAAIKHYSVCKKMADDHLLASGLNYTILRPGRLLNEPATGGFSSAMPEAKEAQIITREDVADACIYCLQTSGTVNKIYPLVNGNQPLANALN